MGCRDSRNSPAAPTNRQRDTAPRSLNADPLPLPRLFAHLRHIQTQPTVLHTNKTDLPSTVSTIRYVKAPSFCYSRPSLSLTRRSSTGKKSEQTKKVTRSPWSKGATGAKYRVCSASLYSLRYRMRCNSSAGPAYYDPVCACRHQAHSTSIHLMCVFSHLSSSVRAHSRYSEGH